MGIGSTLVAHERSTHTEALAVSPASFGPVARTARTPGRDGGRLSANERLVERVDRARKVTVSRPAPAQRSRIYQFYRLFTTGRVAAAAEVPVGKLRHKRQFSRRASEVRLRLHGR